MSTILDALKKSEQQRQQSEAHQGPYVPAHPAARARSPIWFALLTLAVLLGLTLAWLGWRDGGAPVATTNQIAEPSITSQQTAAELEAKRGTDANLATTDAEPVTADAGPVTELVESGAPAAEAPEAPASATGWAVGEVEPAEEKAPSEGRPMRIDAPVTVTDVPATAASPNETPNGSSQAEAMMEPAPSRPSPRQPSASPASELPVYPSIDRDLRNSLGTLKLNMLMYSTDAERRFALINMQRVVEGDEVGAATISAVRQDGVVLEVNGRQFLLAHRN